MRIARFHQEMKYLMFFAIFTVGFAAVAEDTEGTSNVQTFMEPLFLDNPHFDLPLIRYTNTGQEQPELPAQVCRLYRFQNPRRDDVFLHMMRGDLALTPPPVNPGWAGGFPADLADPSSPLTEGFSNHKQSIVSNDIFIWEAQFHNGVLTIHFVAKKSHQRQTFEIETDSSIFNAKKIHWHMEWIQRNATQSADAVCGEDPNIS